MNVNSPEVEAVCRKVFPTDLVIESSGSFSLCLTVHSASLSLLEKSRIGFPCRIENAPLRLEGFGGVSDGIRQDDIMTLKDLENALVFARTRIVEQAAAVLVACSMIDPVFKLKGEASWI